MKGLLKEKQAGTQLLILISVALASFFLVGILCTVLLANMVGMDLETLSDVNKWNPEDSRTVTVIRGMQLIQFISLFVIPVFICARLFGTRIRNYLGLKFPSNNMYFIAGAALLLLALPLTNLLGEINRGVRFPSGLEQWMKSQEEEASKTIKLLLSRQSIPDLLMNLFFIAGLAAVGEELLFRGMAQRLLIRWFKSPWPGIIITAILFSALHVQFYGFLPRFVLGILLGALYWYSGSLWTAIWAHFIYDALLIVLVYFNPELLGEQNNGGMKISWMASIISGTAVLVIVWWMKKNSKTEYREIYSGENPPIKDHSS